MNKKGHDRIRQSSERSKVENCYVALIGESELPVTLPALFSLSWKHLRGYKLPVNKACRLSGCNKLQLFWRHLDPSGSSFRNGRGWPLLRQRGRFHPHQSRRSGQADRCFFLDYRHDHIMDYSTTSRTARLGWGRVHFFRSCRGDVFTNSRNGWGSPGRPSSTVCSNLWAKSRNLSEAEGLDYREESDWASRHLPRRDRY